MRYVENSVPADYGEKKVGDLVHSAIQFAISEIDNEGMPIGGWKN